MPSRLADLCILDEDPVTGFDPKLVWFDRAFAVLNQAHGLLETERVHRALRKNSFRKHFLEKRNTPMALLRVMKVRFVQTHNIALIQEQREQGRATEGWAANEEHV